MSALKALSNIIRSIDMIMGFFMSEGTKDRKENSLGLLKKKVALTKFGKMLFYSSKNILILTHILTISNPLDALMYGVQKSFNM